MASTKLILRTLNSGFPTPFQDITLGSVLSHADLDNNFIYLKGELVYSGTISGSTLTLNKINGDTIDLDLSGIVSSGGTSGDTYVTGATLSGTTLILTRNDAVNVPVDLSSITGSGGTYTNSGATPTTIGGISAGSTFSAQTMQQMWDALLYPYQPPAVTITNPSLFKTYEFGELVTSGLTSINYSVTNSSNIKVQPPDIGVPSTNIGGATFPSNPFTLAGAGSFDINIPAGFTYTNTGSTSESNTVTLQGTNTLNNTFNNLKTLTWRHKRYWGTHPTFTTPNNAQIIAADGASVGSGSEFSTSRSQTRNGIDGGGNYLFFAWPVTFGTPTFTVNGLPNTAWTKVGNAISFTNASGHIEPYDIWISNTAQFSPITLFTIT